jgi:hypothetical protein
VTLRERSPSPQAGEHAVHGPGVHARHFSVLQSDTVGGCVPVHAVEASPDTESTQRTVRVRVPPPQTLEQSLHSDASQ